MFKFAAVMLGAAALMAPAAHAGTTLQAAGAPSEITLASAPADSWAAASRHAGPWQAAGTLLGRATGAPEIAPGSNGYRYTLVTPMTLAAGEQTFAADRASAGDGDLSALAASGLAMAADNIFGAANAEAGSRFPLLDTVTATDGGQVSAKFTFRSIASRLPEPATWILMILGFGAIGGLMRYHIRRSEARFTAKLRRIAAGEDA